MITIKSSIKLNWQLAYIGIIKNWISPKHVLTFIDTEELNKLDENTIGDLYSLEEGSKDEFVKILEKITNITDTRFAENLYIWGILFLNDINTNQKTTSEKLKEIANIWVMVDYPENWKPFIYYMPQKEDKPVGGDYLYQKFINFLEVENLKLKQKGQVIQ